MACCEWVLFTAASVGIQSIIHSAMCIVTLAVCVYHVYRQSESNACKTSLILVMAASYK